MTVRTLLKSPATPPASRPTASILRAWVSCSSSCRRPDWTPLFDRKILLRRKGPVGRGHGDRAGSGSGWHGGPDALVRRDRESGGWRAVEADRRSASQAVPKQEHPLVYTPRFRNHGAHVGHRFGESEVHYKNGSE